MGRYAFAVSLVIVCAAFIVLSLPAMRGEVYTGDDAELFNLPMRHLYAQSLRAGESFLWTPAIFCGYYLHGEGQIGMAHPWHLLLYRFLPLGLAFNVEMVGSYALALIGMALFLRRWRVARHAALFGAVIFAFAPFSMLHYMHVNLVAVAAHVPWAMWATDLCLRGMGRRRRMLGFCVMAVVTTSQFLLGYPQMVIITWLIQGAYALLFLRRAGARRAGLVVLGVMLGMAIAAAQILPTLEHLDDTTRVNISDRFRHQGTLHPANLLQIFAPYAYGFEERVWPDYYLGRNTHEFGVYAGAITLPLAILAWLVRRGRRRRRFMIWCAVLAVLSLWLAVGEFGKLYALQGFIPVLRSLRCPCRYAFFIPFAGAILAAFAMDGLTHRMRRASPLMLRRACWVLLPAVVSLLGVTLLWTNARLSASNGTTSPIDICTGSPLALATSVLLVAAAGALVAVCATGRRWALWLLLPFALLDQGSYGLTYMRLTPPKTPEAVSQAWPMPQGPITGRCLEDDMPTFGNLPVLRGVHMTGGYVGLFPKHQIPPTSRSATRLLGIQWVHPADAAPEWFHKDPTQTHAEQKDFLPRVRLVSKTLVSASPMDELESVDVETTAILSAPVSLDAGPAGQAETVGEGPGRLRVKASSPGRQLLIVSESHHRGWRATVDGQPTDVVRVYGAFLGCVVPKGKHDVVLTFKPRSFTLGLRVSAAGLLATLAFLLAWRLFRWSPRGASRS